MNSYPINYPESEIVLEFSQASNQLRAPSKSWTNNSDIEVDSHPIKQSELECVLYFSHTGDQLHALIKPCTKSNIEMGSDPNK